MSFISKIFNTDVDDDAIIGLTSELNSIYIDNFFKNTDNSIFVVTNSLYEANMMYQSLLNYNSKVLLFPMDDFLTSEAVAISPELKTTRLETMIKLLEDERQIIVTNLMGYLRFLPTKKSFKDNIVNLCVGEEIKINELVEKLYNNGYTREVVVNRTGDIAVRGYVIDIFPISYSDPIRIEFWGDEIEDIRLIDIDTQRTKEKINKISIYPNTEFILANDNVNIVEKKQRMLNVDGNAVSVLEYGKKPILFFKDYTNIKIAYEQLLKEMYEYSLSINLAGDTSYMNDFYGLCRRYKNKYLMTFDEGLQEAKSKRIFSAKNVDAFSGNDEKINKYLNQYLKLFSNVVVALNNKQQINKIIKHLNNSNFIITNENKLYPNKINIIEKKMNSGFAINDLIVITGKELFNEEKKNTFYKTKFKVGSKIRDINKLTIGDYVVHRAYGIGIYNGIKTLTKNGLKKDYLMISYKGKDKLYVPVEKIEFINKYTSKDGVVPKLNSLKGSEWEKVKIRVQKRIENIAGDLLKLYAKREASRGFSFMEDQKEQKEFEKQFEYQETSDQLRAIAEIKKDMESNKPMDRLLCGDVGFGKTEVAFRASFKAIMSGKQVAFLCPTTILSKQHYLNAIKRFEAFGCNVALLNRFVTMKEATQIKKDLKIGKIDLIIGTHRLLSDDIEFKDLGLLVIDEEQRFGVKHKEKIKKMKETIDVLTLTATPIPRTLQLSMTGLRSLSLIETPPVNRYPVQTYVMAKNEHLLKDAIYKELSRNGQVFLLYNHIDSIELEAHKIHQLVPEARIVIAHGQMTKQKLENVMAKFIDHEYDILICTTIIETGIDIPNVNTLIIEDADKFGLSQLYQIRGRVGRSDKIAYCYLMYDPSKVLSEIAQKRLNVIKDFAELGSGFAIAMRDLSIRGAGDILGQEQAGFIDAVGIDLFIQMLNEEVSKIKGEPIVASDSKSNMPVIDVSTYISDDYIQDEELKIYIHKRINNIDSYDSLLSTKKELEDRFGKLSEDIIIYMYEEWLEKLVNKLNITNIEQTKNSIIVELPKELTNNISGDVLFSKLSDITRNFRFSMAHNNLFITLDIINLDKHFVYYLIDLMKIIEHSIIIK